MSRNVHSPRIVGDPFELTDDQTTYKEINPIDPRIFNPKPKEWERVIELTRGYITVVDESMFGELSRHTWCAVTPNKSKVYAVRRGKMSEKHWFEKFIYLHRQIAGVVDNPDLEVDHINGNSLTNVSSNLYPGSRGKNMQNCILHTVGGTSKFRGVYIYPSYTKTGRAMGERRCVAYVNFKGKKHTCGRFHFSEEIKAALARDAKVIELMDDVNPQVLRNILNFPDKFCLVDKFQQDEDIPF